MIGPRFSDPSSEGPNFRRDATAELASATAAHRWWHPEQSNVAGLSTETSPSVAAAGT